MKVFSDADAKSIAGTVEVLKDRCYSRASATAAAKRLSDAGTPCLILRVERSRSGRPVKRYIPAQLVARTS